MDFKKDQNPFLHPRFTPDEIERWMPVDDRVAVLKGICNGEVCGWYGRLIAKRILRGVAFGIVRDAVTQMEKEVVL